MLGAQPPLKRAPSTTHGTKTAASHSGNGLLLMENWLCEMQVAPDKDDFSDAPVPQLWFYRTEVQGKEFSPTATMKGPE